MNIKVDPRMKSALKDLAERQFISVSATVKQAIEKHLLDQGIDWRQGNNFTSPSRGGAEPVVVSESAQGGEFSFYSVEIPSGDNLIHQFNIQEVATDGTYTILMKEGSRLLEELKAGDELSLKFYSLNPLLPVEIKTAEVVGIAKKYEGRFKGHYAVALRVAEETP
ncbi:MAG: hypothetical protein JRK53_10170 [Deltaproteobacteria bacterium]|nr:hypothetical protein [Deltaproteobacteria bacterium]MBW2284197.1 hypothetical protein [Deltaproteobacteria bacterium]